MSALPPFAEASRCAKCGASGAAVAYRPAVIIDGEERQPERIVRTCARCGYSWAEACADATER